jgi:hypothetical protein
MMIEFLVVRVAGSPPWPSYFAQMKISWNSPFKASCGHHAHNYFVYLLGFTRFTELKYGECSIVFVGGVDSYPFKKMNQVYALKQNQHFLITDPFIRHFESFTKFKEFVQSSQDAEYATVVKLVEKYDAQCPQLMAQLQSRLAPLEKRNCVVLTTAHKSKGLEFDHVKLGDDFIDLNENLSALSGPLDHSLVEELNILYVAVSRARYSLEIPSKLKRFMASQGCCLEQPRLFCERQFSLVS